MRSFICAVGWGRGRVEDASCNGGLLEVGTACSAHSPRIGCFLTTYDEHAPKDDAVARRHAQLDAKVGPLRRGRGCTDRDS